MVFSCSLIGPSPSRYTLLNRTPNSLFSPKRRPISRWPPNCESDIYVVVKRVKGSSPARFGTKLTVPPKVEPGGIPFNIAEGPFNTSIRSNISGEARYKGAIPYNPPIEVSRPAATELDLNPRIA